MRDDLVRLPHRLAVQVLVRQLIELTEIDLTRAEAAKLRAEQRISGPDPTMDFERARIAMMKSLVRLQVASRTRIRS